MKRAGQRALSDVFVRSGLIARTRYSVAHSSVFGVENKTYRSQEAGARVLLISASRT